MGAVISKAASIMDTVMNIVASASIDPVYCTEFFVNSRFCLRGRTRANARKRIYNV